MKKFLKKILFKLIAHYLVETIEAIMALIYKKVRIIKSNINAHFIIVNQKRNSQVIY